MNDKLKEELQKTNYKKPNFTTLFGWLIAIIALTFFFFIIPPFSDDSGTERSTSKRSSSRSTGPRSGQIIPVKVWSQTHAIPPGCSYRFDAGNGEIFEVRYSFYGSDWKIHPADGSSPNSDKVQFRMLRPGMTNFTFSARCGNDPWKQVSPVWSYYESSVQPTPQVFVERFSLPARETVRIPRQGNCNTSNIPDGTKFTRKDLQNYVEYTSHEEEAIFVKLWFYNREGGSVSNCKDRLFELQKQGLID